MPKLPQISGEKLVRALLKDGWLLVGQKGSHIKLRKLQNHFGQSTIIVPYHKNLKKGTLSGILKQSKISIEKLKTLSS